MYNNIIPQSLINDYLNDSEVKKRIAEKEKTRLKIPEYFINPEYIVSLPKSYYNYIYSDRKVYGSLSFVDHPSFDMLRRDLESEGYIRCSHNSVNGDIVLKSFILNGVKFSESDRFNSSGCLVGKIQEAREFDYISWKKENFI